jgi:lipid A ethanolaminephosphotransferase
VPCLFSAFGRERFSHAAFAGTESLFGMLERLGVDVAWRDNSTGCKNVCDAAHFEEFAAESDPTYCDATGCFDEILLRNLAAVLADPTRDHFIVLHQRGSHGPAYHTDTPRWSKTFLPECDLPNPRNCDRESINNSYDNTILYTDYFLAKVVEFLARHEDVYDVGLLYVSDHGESLGENGLYLHGFPYALAPVEQTHVPMLFWGSTDFYEHHGIDVACVRANGTREYSHDTVFHTLLPLYYIESPVYREELDVFAPCRSLGSQLFTRRSVAY